MVNKFSNIKERIIYFIESKGVKKEHFFNEIGMTSANFRGKAQETPLNSTAIENIITKYPEINLQWLLTGKGKMIEENEPGHFLREPVAPYGSDETRQLQRITKIIDELLAHQITRKEAVRQLLENN